MKPIYEASHIHIDITNACTGNCNYCSRYTRHLRDDQRYFMSLDYFEKALKALEDYPGMIGFMGGDPILHPQFNEVCEIVRASGKNPPERMSLFTCAKEPAWSKTKDSAYKTFHENNVWISTHKKNIDHTHQPITLAIDEVVSDKEYKQHLIDHCWVNLIWCPAVNHKGGFFCEVAMSLDLLLDGPGGFDAIDPNWWKAEPDDFKHQVDCHCNKCGMAIPLETEVVYAFDAGDYREKFTPKLHKEFADKKLKRLGPNDAEVITEFPTTEQLKKIEATRTPAGAGNYNRSTSDEEFYETFFKDMHCPDYEGIL